MEWLTDEQIGAIIKQRRLEKKLTQGELGKKIGVGGACVQKWESGRVTNIKRNALKKLAEVLELNPAVLIGYNTEDFMITSVKELNDVQRGQIASFIQFIKGCNCK